MRLLQEPACSAEEQGTNAAEGVIVGVGTVTGNPVEIRTPGLATSAGGTTQPFVVVAGPCTPVIGSGVGMLVRQFCKKPGILPAIAVTWNVDKVSNSQE